MANLSGDTMERIVALCKRRGFIFQSSDIYGGLNGFWDYGPLGVELKRNVKGAWWNDMVAAREDMVGIDCSIIMHPQVWRASGHYDLFCDMMRDCKECKARFRGDFLDRAALWAYPEEPPASACVGEVLKKAQAPDKAFLIEPTQNVEDAAPAIKAQLKTRKLAWRHITNTMGQSPDATLPFCNANGQWYFVQCDVGPEVDTLERCPRCGGELTEPREFNLMFESYAGAVKDEDNKVFLRPETAQGIFVNFKNVLDSTRIKLPFGIAQIGKSFRNEITPRNYTFRSREFEQMEIEFFCHPSESNRWYEYWRDERFKWYTRLGLGSEKLQLREHDKDELSHYSCGTSDIEYAFPFLPPGKFGELEGVAHRGDYDLTVHMKGSMNPDGTVRHKGSGKDLTYFDDERKERFVPHVIEPSAGADRATLAFICEAYTVDESRPSPELMRFHPRLAPIKAAVFPLVNKDGMPEIARPIYEEIRKHLPSQYDAKASIGKRYARMDEAGTPFCFTVDGQTKEDGTVTVRDRDTGSQERIDKSRCLEYLRDKLKA